mmetsp:Transcript_25416/g.46146  ORF Transcript_25416/g.46146 Transcript_25416/m.46146 type:complete len:950 (-) Transcript_25416:65-2914(-)
MEGYFDDEEGEDELPEWMRILKGPKPTPPQARAAPAATGRRWQDTSPKPLFRAAAAQAEEVKVPMTSLAAPSTPPQAAEEDKAEIRSKQLIHMLFSDKAGPAYDQLRRHMQDYLQQRCIVPAFPRRLTLLRGPPGVGTTQWAMHSFNKGESLSRLSSALVKQLAHVCSPADFSGQLRNGKWEVQLLVDRVEDEARSLLNEARVRLAMELGLEPLFLDACNTRLWEMRPFVSLADRFGYVVTVVSPQDVSPRWQDVDFLLARQSELDRQQLEKILSDFEELPGDGDPRPLILASEPDQEVISTPIPILPTALLYKLECLLLEGSDLLRYVPPDGDGWGVNGQLGDEWHHFREKADGSCSYDDRLHWFSKSPEEGVWQLAELTMLKELRGQASDLPEANLPSAVSHPGLFVKEEIAETATASFAPSHQSKASLRVAASSLPGAVPASRAERLRHRMQEKRQAEEDTKVGQGPRSQKRLRTDAAKFSKAAVPDRDVQMEGAGASAMGDPTEDEEVSASTFLAAVKARLLEWGKVQQYHDFVLALSGSVDARAAVRILRGHDDLLQVFQRKFAPKADLTAIKAEIEEDDAPRPPSNPPGHPVVKQEYSESQLRPVKQEPGRSTPRPPSAPPRLAAKQELGVKAEVKSEITVAELRPRPPAFSPDTPRLAVSVGDDSDGEEILDEASIAEAVRRGRDECIAQLAKTIFKRERAKGLGARQRIDMVRYASQMAAKPRFPRELFILRGVPGTGKSEYALQHLMDYVGFAQEDALSARLTHVCAADDFFEMFQDASVYKFEAHRLESCHRQNEVRTMLAMEAGLNPLYVDCANLRLWEMRPYLLLAERLGYVVTIVEAQDICEKWDDANFLTSANDTVERQELGKAIPAAQLKAMLQALQPLPRQALEAVRKATRPHGPRAIEVIRPQPASTPSFMQVKAEHLARTAQSKKPQMRWR